MAPNCSIFGCGQWCFLRTSTRWSLVGDDQAWYWGECWQASIFRIAKHVERIIIWMPRLFPMCSSSLRIQTVHTDVSPDPKAIVTSGVVWRDVAIHAPRMFNAICPAELASQKAQAVFTGTICTAAELSYSKCPQYHKLCKYNTEKLGGPICSWDWKLEVWRIEGIAGSMCLCWYQSNDMQWSMAISGTYHIYGLCKGM